MLAAVKAAVDLTMDRPLEELYKAFHLLNDKIFDGQLNEPAILIQYQGNRTRNIYGWCTINKIWGTNDKSVRKYEINITTEYLTRDFSEVIHTLLHEMVHLYCSENGIQDTSRNGHYHNKRFRAAAESAGLDVEFDKSRGWAETKLRPATKALIETFGLDKDAFVLKRFTWEDDEETDDEEKEPKKRNKKEVWCCPKCQDQKIKSNKILNILCGRCTERFVLFQEEKNEENDT